VERRSVTGFISIKVLDMTEANFELIAKFKTSDLRDKAIEFLNDEGPAFEDEVEEHYRQLFVLMEDVDKPLDIKTVGECGLHAFFEVFGGDGIFNAQEYMETCDEAGATKIYGYFQDDEELELYWILKGGELTTIYTAYEDEEQDKVLWAFDDENRFKKVIELYEAGELI
jgi:hypothetical protein